MKFALVALLALLATSSAWGDDALDTRLKSLENELRCLVCQNQTLAESNAPLAEDLRKEVRDLATGGKSDDEIRAYLVARYGDFVLYKPPVRSTTYVLWFGPFVLLAAGAVAWWMLIRRRSRATGDARTLTESSTPGAVARARVLLDE
jgi:cytochrome c-type biogenesis protein CcmH